jgi:tRNA1(Val) A37 N6-methylase TrmN6
LLRNIGPVGNQAMTLLDIGSGIGVIAHELLASGISHATVVEASAAYLQMSEEKALRRGHRDRIAYHHGDFVDLAGTSPAADIVTLDRVICCYPDMDKLVEASASKAKHLYGLVYPRERWVTRIAAALLNVALSLRGGAFRTYIHSSDAVEAIIEHHGFRRKTYACTFLWQVATYARPGPHENAADIMRDPT